MLREIVEYRPVHITHADWHAAAECMGACREAENLDEVLNAVMPRLRRIFQADLVMWTTYAEDMSVTGYRMFPQIPVDHLFAPFLAFFHEHPWHANLRAMLRQGRVRLLSDTMPLRTLLRTGLWNEVYVHLFSKHQLGFGGMLDHSTLFSFGINRLARDYESRDRELTNHMKPALRSMIRQAARRELTRNLASVLHRFFAEGENAYAWISCEGRMKDVSPEAQRLLQAHNLTLASEGTLARAVQDGLRRMGTAPAATRRFVALHLGTLDVVMLSLGVSEGALLLFQAPAIRSKVPLTRRETEVLHWLGEGKTNPEIGVICGISPRTVGRHCENLFAKLGVESRHAAALLARDMDR